MTTAATIDTQLEDAAARFTLRRIALERTIAAAGAVNPAALSSALENAHLAESTIEDDQSRYLCAASIIAPNVSTAVRLAGRAMVLDGYARQDILTLALQFCPTCAAAGQPCNIAAALLPSLCGKLAWFVDAERDAKEALRVTFARLEAA